MSSSVRVVPNSQEALDAFRQIILAPNEETSIVEMNDETARNIDVIWASVESVAARWRGTQEVHYPGMPMDRKEFWGAFSADHEPGSLPVVEEFVKKSRGEGKTAIDLGCGNSPSVPLLLQRGWRVIAVDNSRSSLDILSSRNKAAVASGQLSIIEADVAAYTPPESADLVIASDIFPYINPTKFRATWTKIHDVFIKKNGFLIGTLFRSAPSAQEVPPMNLMKEMGAWFLPDRRMVRPLLTHAGYEIKTCNYRIDGPNMEPLCIQFIAEKKTANK